jgi:hypothetical protein
MIQLGIQLLVAPTWMCIPATLLMTIFQHRLKPRESNVTCWNISHFPDFLSLKSMGDLQDPKMKVL